jgi:nucleotide-binding universal stress UspA family protein
MLLHGNTSRAIAGFAETLGPSLIVIASHGRRGVRRLVLGSVASELIHRASVPVVVQSPEGS